MIKNPNADAETCRGARVVLSPGLELKTSFLSSLLTWTSRRKKFVKLRQCSRISCELLRYLEEHVFTYLELLATPYLDPCWCFAIKSDFKCQLKLETLFIFAKLCYFCLFFMENCATLCYWCRNRFVSRVVQNPLGSWMWILQVKFDLKGKLVKATFTHRCTSN